MYIQIWNTFSRFFNYSPFMPNDDVTGQIEIIKVQFICTNKSHAISLSDPQLNLKIRIQYN